MSSPKDAKSGKKGYVSPACQRSSVSQVCRLLRGESFSQLGISASQSNAFGLSGPVLLVPESSGTLDSLIAILENAGYPCQPVRLAGGAHVIQVLLGKRLREVREGQESDQEHLSKDDSAASHCPGLTRNDARSNTGVIVATESQFAESLETPGFWRHYGVVDPKLLPRILESIYELWSRVEGGFEKESAAASS